MNLEEIKDLKELGFTPAQIVQMQKGKGTVGVNSNNTGLAKRDSKSFIKFCNELIEQQKLCFKGKDGIRKIFKHPKAGSQLYFELPYKRKDGGLAVKGIHGRNTDRVVKRR